MYRHSMMGAISFARAITPSNTLTHTATHEKILQRTSCTETHTAWRVILFCTHHGTL